MRTSSPSFTFGIEEEYHLVDLETRDLAAAPLDLMGACEDVLGKQVAPEFFRSQIEIGTQVCSSFDQAREELARLRGTISWPGFGPNGEDWLGFVFVVEAWSGDVPDRNDEGPLDWVPRERVLQACDDDESVRDAAALPMWEGDRWFLPLVFDDDPRAFHGVMPYSQGRPTDWRFERW